MHAAIDANKNSGIPLGGWTSFENDTAPNTEWLQAGTTFDPDTYPELFLYLGGNTVPERYDHSRLGNYQSITLPTSSATAMIMQYDGILIYVPRYGSIAGVYINGTYIYADDGGSDAYGSATVSFKAGDIIYATVNGSQYSKVAYYTHPLFIKATTTASSYTPSSAVQEIKDYTKDYVDAKCPSILDYTTLTLLQPEGVANYTPYSYTATENCFFALSQSWGGSAQEAKGVYIYSDLNGSIGPVIQHVFPTTRYGAGTTDAEIKERPSMLSTPIYLKRNQKIWYKWVNYSGYSAINARVRILTKTTD